MNSITTYLSITKTGHKNRALRIALKTLFIFIVIALLAPLLANDRPLVCKHKNTWMFPAFSLNNNHIISSSEIINYNMGKEWKLISLDFVLFPPCAYSPTSIDAENAPGKSPFDEQFITYKNESTHSLPLKFRHWLGTTQNGNDVLSNMVYGARIAICIGIFSMLIASVIGICLGASAGFFQNDQLKTGPVSLILNGLALFMIWFYGMYVRSEAWVNSLNSGGLLLIINIIATLLISIITLMLFHKLGKWIEQKTGLRQNIRFPLDTVISRIIEVLNSIPALLLIIAVSAIAKPSYTLLIIIIGFLSWTSIARLARAEFLKAKQLDYVTSCRAIGMSHFKIMQKQILPNVLPVLLVQIVFGMGSAVLAEASLSFIGIGVPLNSASWGNLLNEGRDHFSSWWLVVFPGLCIFVLIFAYNTIAKQLGKTSAAIEMKEIEKE